MILIEAVNSDVSMIYAEITLEHTVDTEDAEFYAVKSINS